MFDSVGKKKKIVNYKRHSFTNEKVIISMNISWLSINEKITIVIMKKKKKDKKDGNTV